MMDTDMAFFISILTRALGRSPPVIHLKIYSSLIVV